MTRVVNRHHRIAFDTYIGRGTPFGNPFVLPKGASDQERAECLARFEPYFLDRVGKDPEFRRLVLSLRGKTLACSCKPKACHGDIIAAWVDAQALVDLREACLGCRKCRLAEGRRSVVFGEGPVPTRLVVVGEGPGAAEDETGRPFVGSAGTLLSRILRDAGLERRDVYITNVVKCRPPGNRDPEPDEMRACRDWLDEQIQIVRPRVLVGLGRFAVSRLSGEWGSMGSLLGMDLRYQGTTPVIPAYHPSYILRQLGGEKSRARELYLDAVGRFRRAGALASEQK